MQYFLEYNWVPSPDREKQPVVIPLYSETGIQKTCPVKPSLAQRKVRASLPGLYISLLLTRVSPKTLYVNPLRHCVASGSLCITPSALCVNDKVSLGSALPLLGSA